jgi:hypothetical protein
MTAGSAVLSSLHSSAQMGGMGSLCKCLVATKASCGEERSRKKLPKALTKLLTKLLQLGLFFGPFPVLYSHGRIDG